MNLVDHDLSYINQELENLVPLLDELSAEHPFKCVNENNLQQFVEWFITVFANVARVYDVSDIDRQSKKRHESFQSFTNILSILMNKKEISLISKKTKVLNEKLRDEKKELVKCSISRNPKWSSQVLEINKKLAHLQEINMKNEKQIKTLEFIIDQIKHEAPQKIKDLIGKVYARYQKENILFELESNINSINILEKESVQNFNKLSFSSLDEHNINVKSNDLKTTKYEQILQTKENELEELRKKLKLNKEIITKFQNENDILRSNKTDADAKIEQLSNEVSDLRAYRTASEFSFQYAQKLFLKKKPETEPNTSRMKADINEIFARSSQLDKSLPLAGNSFLNSRAAIGERPALSGFSYPAVFNTLVHE